MDQSLRRDADLIIQSSLQAVLPDAAVRRALRGFRARGGHTVLVAVGKAAWQMAMAAVDTLGAGTIDGGIVITKYGHVMGELPQIVCCEGGHPIPDAGSFAGTRKALAMVRDLTEEDTVLFLLSGGGSALFEQPLIPAEELQDITQQLLACGADIREINTIRKRLSAVKGGRFAQLCVPARVYSIVLSDIIGDPLDMIASGPAYPDTSTCAQASEIVRKYSLNLSVQAQTCLAQETPKMLNNVTTQITGSVRELCAAAAAACRRLGYEPVLLTDQLCCEAREAGSFLASILRTHALDTDAGAAPDADAAPANPAASIDAAPADLTARPRSLAFIAGGETIVHLTGKGMGGRNQELALAAAPGIAGLSGAAVFSVGSDGTDGPTDAAGGYVDGGTLACLRAQGMEIAAVLAANDAYHALEAAGGLIQTGPTGTNVNDVAVALLRR